ncbi:hypothetical protein ACHAWU_008897 [Discostella pseudostelligera]|uniref:SGNH hydrolase-type esterase domain-containing protein n=1 Tax=Discostella pseudostelligera TaxID=259834 RepID=A0ABD3LZ95_9STRA
MGCSHRVQIADGTSSKNKSSPAPTATANYLWRLPSYSRPERTAFVKFYLPHHHYDTMPLPNEYQRNDFIAASDQNRHFGMNNRLDIDFTMDTSPPLAGPPSHAMEASASFFVSSTLSLFSHILSTIFGACTFVLSSLASILLPSAAQLQRVGETLLATFLLLSVIQALVALYQYRYDARGQLVFPDGLTYGEEDYYANHNVEKSSNTTLKNGEDDKPIRATVSDDMPMSSSNATIIDNINDSNLRRILTKFNKSLVLLLPWITQNVHNLLTKNTHLFHIGFIIFILDSLLPLLDGDIDRSAHDDVTEEHDKLGKFVSRENDGSSVPNLATALAKKVFSHPSNDRNPIRILVIGDSLAIGTGCVDRFDIEKTNAMPMALIENNVAKSRSAMDANRLRQGPVFPRILARTLSYHIHRPVQWRSAGVDGGSVSDVQTFCMDVVKQEQAKGIDVIVVLFGMNDLKKHLSVNPFLNLLQNRQEVHGGKGVAGFRLEMDRIISEIHACAPDALVVFPALPIQPFHKNSIINIFPLGLMVDTFVGLWERQKKIAAISRDNAVYVDLKAKEIAEWYTPKNAHNGDICDDIEEDVLLSGDGVHPNRAMYAKWAELVGHKLYRCLLTICGEQLEQIYELGEKDVQLDNNVPAKNTEPNQLRA